MYRVILYYQFSKIDDPAEFCQIHKRKCDSLNLKGRVYIAQEGINGTLAGKEANIEEYKAFLQKQDGFEPTKFKEDRSDYLPFIKLIVKTRPEIVTLSTEEAIDPNDISVKVNRLSPTEWRKILEENKDLILLDVRNEYETRIGHFEGAMKPPVKNFYDFPQWLENTDLDKDKKVLMYCTGGIRCEKFAILMKKRGFKDINQLQGGIINYAKEEKGKHFLGRCFVFDDRLSVPIDQEHQEPLTHCEITGAPCDSYLNCANPECNKLFICSKEGAIKMEGCCSSQCLNSSRKKPFNPENIYEPTRKWYHYFDEKPEQKLENGINT